MKPSNVVSRVKQIVSWILYTKQRVDRLCLHLDEVKLNQGIILSTLNESKTSKNLQDYEFKVFSQFGEDGIIQHLTKIVEIKNRTFIEFGVEDFFESNCRFLLMKDNWKGFVVDGSSSNIKRLKNSYFFWMYHIDAIDAFITKDNINEILVRSGFDEDVGILSVDIDGNDFYVLEAIRVIKPRILICEYNAVFGAKRKISVLYDEHFDRTNKHYSDLYFGASLAAITYLANKRGYTLVGTDRMCGNLFFVRNDLMNNRLESLNAEQVYSPSNVRESRNEQGMLTYITGDDRLKIIKGMPVFNIESQQIEEL